MFVHAGILTKGFLNTFIAELNQSPRIGQVPVDSSLNLTMTLPRINGFGHYCCQFVPSNEISCRNQCEKVSLLACTLAEKLTFP